MIENMRVFRKFKLIAIISFATLSTVYGGNEERAGQAGASQLLVNPWSRSTGMGGAGMVFSTGIEAMQLNVAGLAEIDKLEILFSHRQWLGISSGIDVNAAGTAVQVGESGVIGFEIMAMSFGKIEQTTVNLPEGGIGIFSPLYFTGAIAYAKKFSQRINGGLTIKIVHEEIGNVQADGIAIDAGVNYTTGINDQIKFGIALRNVGPAMQYKGTGLTVVGQIPGSGSAITQQQRSQRFEMPSLLNIGASYDFLFIEVDDSLRKNVRSEHRITPAFNYTSNSFTPDLYALGLEYAFKEMFMARGGYIIQGASGTDDLGSLALTGLSLGATVEYPLSRKKNNGTAALDFSWQATKNFGGITSLGIRLNL